MGASNAGAAVVTGESLYGCSHALRFFMEYLEGNSNKEARKSKPSKLGIRQGKLQSHVIRLRTKKTCFIMLFVSQRSRRSYTIIEMTARVSGLKILNPGTSVMAVQEMSMLLPEANLVRNRELIGQRRGTEKSGRSASLLPSRCIRGHACQMWRR